MIKEQWKIYKAEIKEAWKDLRTKGRRVKQIPNILTSLRLLAPAFILPASFVGNISLVLGFVVGFSVTDMLDGLIARTFHLTSKLGKDLDAFCDKVFAGTLLVASSFINPIMLVSLLLESMIASINIKAKLEGKETKSLYIGKAKTLFLFPLLGLSLVSDVLSIEPIFKAFFGVTTTLQVLATFSYMKKYHFEEKEREENVTTDETIVLVEDEEDSEKEKQKELEKGPSTKASTKISTLKDIRELLLKETAQPEMDKNKENKKK